jgi:hypothetical protein
VGWLYVVPDAGKGSTPNVMAAFTCAVHDRQSATHQDYYRGDNQQRGFHRSWSAEANRSLMYRVIMNAR